MTDLRLDHIEHADALTYLRTLPDESVNLIVTSPPYFSLRSYLPSDHPDKAREIGSEPTPAEFIAALVAVFTEARRVLRSDGNTYVNLGDSYASRWPAPSNRRNVVGQGSLENGKREARPPRMEDGRQEKSLIGIPWRFAFAMQDAGWLLREDIIWAKDNPMPESVRDRCTRAHEFVFHFTKQPHYWYDQTAVMEPMVTGANGSSFTDGKTAALRPNVGKGPRKQDGVGRRYTGFNARYEPPAARNRRSVWRVNTKGFKEAHFATFPEELVEPMVLAGCPEGGVVLDMFIGAGTVGLVAKRLNRHYVGCDLNGDYVRMAIRRVNSIPYTLFSLMEANGD